MQAAISDRQARLTAHIFQVVEADGDRRKAEELAGGQAEQEAQRILGETEPHAEVAGLGRNMMSVSRGWERAFVKLTPAFERHAETALAESLARFCEMDEAEAWEAFGRQEGSNA